MLVRIMWRLGLPSRGWRRRLWLMLRGMRLLRWRGLRWVLSLGPLRLRGSRCGRRLPGRRMPMLLLRQCLVLPLLLCLNLRLRSPGRSIFSGR
jgi:hypothetical protein